MACAHKAIDRSVLHTAGACEAALDLASATVSGEWTVCIALPALVNSHCTAAAFEAIVHIQNAATGGRHTLASVPETCNMTTIIDYWKMSQGRSHWLVSPTMLCSSYYYNCWHTLR
eukprot:5637-Heterococcus_DN1.PRE.1